MQNEIQGEIEGVIAGLIVQFQNCAEEVRDDDDYKPMRQRYENGQVKELESALEYVEQLFAKHQTHE